MKRTLRRYPYSTNVLLCLLSGCFLLPTAKVESSTAPLNDEESIENAYRSLRSIRQRSVIPPYTYREFLTEVEGSKTEEIVNVPSARVAIADYDLLRKEVPLLADVGTDREIEKWLIDNFAFFSLQHLESEDFASFSKGVPRGATTKRAIRPPQYGRALIIPAFPERTRVDAADPSFTDDLEAAPVFDVKGVGTDGKREGGAHHEDGLVFFSNAMREYHYEKLVSAIFAARGHPVQVNPVYAIIHLGLQAVFDGNIKMGVALVVRRARPRKGPNTTYGGLPLYRFIGTFKTNSHLTLVGRETELLLRRHGLTSASLFEGSGTPGPIDFVNLQFTRFLELIDFGSFYYANRFEYPLRLVLPSDSETYRPPQRAQVLPALFTEELKPDEPRFVKVAHREIQIAERLWGTHPMVKSLLDIVPESLKVEGRTNAHDTPGLAGVWLGEASQEMADLDFQKAALEQHCLLMVPTLRKLGLNPADFSSTKGCDHVREPPLAVAFVSACVTAVTQLQSVVTGLLSPSQEGCNTFEGEENTSYVQLTEQVARGLTALGSQEAIRTFLLAQLDGWQRNITATWNSYLPQGSEQEGDEPKAQEEKE